MHKSARVTALLVGLVVSASATANAQTFFNQSAWTAAVNGAVTTVDFSSVPTPYGVTPNGPGSYAVGPFSISGADFSASVLAFVVDPVSNDPFYDWGSGNVFSPQATDPANQVNQMFVNLPGNFFAYGFLYGTNSGGNGADWQLTLSNGNSYVVPSNSTSTNTLAFFGVISSTSFNAATLTITDQSFAPIIDNVAWGQTTTAAPEPSSVVLLGTGLVGLVGWRRKGRTQQA
jgi:hypothetical protein